MSISKGRNILLVEDNVADADLTRLSLKRAKIEANLTVVIDGTKAIEYLYKQGEYEGRIDPDPDLILLDLNMPKMNGKEVLEKIKQDDNLKRIPVLILSSSQRPEDINTAYDLGANACITKPVDLKNFVEVLTTIEAFWFKIVNPPIK